MPEPREAAPAPVAWITLELTGEQQRIILDRTGRDAAVLFMSVEEVASRRFFAGAGGEASNNQKPPDAEPPS